MAAKFVIAVDFGHGGRDPGASAGGKTEAGLVRTIGKPLIESINSEGRHTALSSFEIGKKDAEKDTWPAPQRMQALSAYAKQNHLDQIISIHLNGEATGTASGIVVCHNNLESDAQLLHDTATAYASSQGFNIVGNRVEKIQDRQKLAILKVLVQHLSSMNISKDAKKIISQSILYELGQQFSGNRPDATFQTVSHAVELSIAPRLLDKKQADRLIAAIKPIAQDFEHSAVLFAESGIFSVSAEGKSSRIPALLVECGFITNAADRKLILEHPELYAEAIKLGIYKILEPRIPAGAMFV